jgi:uncharacterized membrane protein YphA (DoxX/SURF4 family)
MAAANRSGWGLTALRVFLGVFFVFEAISKAGWLMSDAELLGRLNVYVQNANAVNRWYIERVCLPGVAVFARLVLFGELSAGIALLAGRYVRAAALIAMLMVLNFHFASGAIFRYAFLTNGYGLPVLGGLLALALDGRSR